MEPAEILKKAWAAVQEADLPESIHEVAFHEAVDIVRGADDSADATVPSSGSRRRAATGTVPRKPRSSKSPTTATHDRSEIPDEDSFFAALSKESGVDETELRDILQLTRDGKVQVTQPTKDLGDNLAEQARTVVALVANGRAVGLGERPVDADAVRQEVTRKRCLDSGNFSKTVIGRLKGVNRGSTNKEFVVTSKWLGEFKAAVDQAHGRGRPDESGD